MVDAVGLFCSKVIGLFGVCCSATGIVSLFLAEGGGVAAVFKMRGGCE
jgi:hypothetical protein